MKVLPFGHYVVKGHQYCPKCSVLLCKESEIDRKICSGGLFKRCPRTEHFHRGCEHCGAAWLEATFDASGDEVQAALREAFDRAAESGVGEDGVVEVWRDQAVRSVMDS
jgi:hypothetical protein